MNTKMKLLSLALVGLCGFAGSAMAACPAGPAIANGGAWSAAPTFQGALAIATPGLAGTECRLDSTINAGAGGAAFAYVEDDSPTTENRYRASFIIDADSLASQSLLQTANVFSAVSQANGVAVYFSIFGSGSNRVLGYFVKDTSQTSGLYVGSAPLATGENHVEFDLQIGSPGSFTLWVNSNTEASPTIPQHAITNTGTIDTAFLGLSAPSPQFVTSFAGTAVQFDQFDSRRQTFIGY
jgi:hypothetical protein